MTSAPDNESSPSGRSTAGRGDDAAVSVLTGTDGETYLWRPDRPLGAGGYGQVYEATTVDGLPLAVKRVPLRGPGTARWYADARQAEREVVVARRLGADAAAGTGVMPVRDDVLTDDALYLVMPRAECSLGDLIVRDGPLDEAGAREVLLACAHALQVLAQHGVVHRDIKPGNVLRHDGRWVLADLGVARVLEQETSTYTWAGTGTHEYWAPELFNFEPATARTDMYALACTVVEALTGSPPFTGSRLAEQHRADDPRVPPLSDPALHRALVTMLRKDAAARPADPREIVELLSPARPLREDQTALQRLAARAEQRRGLEEQRSAAAERLERQRAAAITELDALWERVEADAQAVAPARAARQDGTWYLTAADGRLVVEVRAPAIASSALLIGTVLVQALDLPPASLVANVRARLVEGLPEWDLLTFEHNAVALERPPLGPVRADGPSGMGLAAFDNLLDRLGEPGLPPVVWRTEPLAPPALLRAFVIELDAAPFGSS